MKDKKWIFELLDKETSGLNMRMENARNQLIFSYNDVVEILSSLVVSRNSKANSTHKETTNPRVPRQNTQP